MEKPIISSKTLNNMQPGVLTAGGFLGDDKRKPERIIEEDLNALNSLGVDKNELVKRMREAFEKSASGFGEWIEINEKIEALRDDSRGKISCPFEDGAFGKTNVQVRKKDRSMQVVFSELSIHLIDNHNFFQGHGAAYRNDPAALAGIFGL